MVEYVVKRDGRTVKFNKQLIVRAIEKADVPRDVADKIADEISARKTTILNVEDIQDLVEKKLMKSKYTKEAQSYVRFRYKKELLRESEALNESLLDIIDNKNEAVSEENSNKNSLVLSTQRDYMAGEVSKYLSKRFFLDPDVVDAHNKEIIHVHDLDYFAQHMFNCFSADTEFITDKGVRAFEDCLDGELVYVKDAYGEWRLATVRRYTSNKLQEIYLQYPDNSVKIVKATCNHRWVLSQGEITTDLKKGDILISGQTVIKIDDTDETLYPTWCVEEPVTKTFTLEGGIVTGNCCLVNLEDVLQNGTVINKTFISKPHSFSTACNIATQVMAAISSNQLGGQSESLAHLAPFVDESRKRIRKEVEKELQDFVDILPKNTWRDKVEEITESRVRDEVKKGVQTIQYQINTLMTTNGKILPL